MRLFPVPETRQTVLMRYFLYRVSSLLSAHQADNIAHT